MFSSQNIFLILSFAFIQVVLSLTFWCETQKDMLGRMCFILYLIPINGYRSS